MTDIFDDMHLDEKLVDRQIEANTNLAALETLAAKLYAGGYVNEGFVTAIEERENTFATGLQLDNLGVAIPHTDAKYVIKQSMAIGILKDPVDFQMMGTPEITVPVKIIFMLAIKEPKKQLEFLQRLIDVFQDAEKVSKILAAKSDEEVVHVFKSII